MELNDIKEALKESNNKIVRVGNPVGVGWLEGELIYNGNTTSVILIGHYITIGFNPIDVTYFQWDAQDVLEIGLRN